MGRMRSASRSGSSPACGRGGKVVEKQRDFSAAGILAGCFSLAARASWDDARRAAGSASWIELQFLHLRVKMRDRDDVGKINRYSNIARWVRSYDQAAILPDELP